MSYTDRYIKLPIRVFNKRLSEITGSEAEDEASFMKIDPFQISSYRPTWDGDDESRTEIVVITQKAGDTTLIYLSIAQFEQLLNEHQR